MADPTPRDDQHVEGHRDLADGEFDVVIVGSGAAGTAAALETGAAGLRTLVVESMDSLGGAASLSGGGCCIAGSPLQSARGVVDDVETALVDWMQWGGEEADEAWARSYLEHAVEDIYKWVEDLGGTWVILEQFEGNSAARWHAPEGGGPRLMHLMRQAADELPVTWVTEADATELVHGASGSVAGVKVRFGSRTRAVRARAVVVATGGFAGNASAIKRYMSKQVGDARVLTGGARGALGSGHAALADLGADFADMQHVWTYPYATVDIRDDSGERGLAVRGITNMIWVNASGARFHDESKRGGATGTPALLAQDPPFCWAIMDREEAEMATLSDPAFGWDAAPDRAAVARFLATSPFAHTEESLDALGRACGMPEGALGSTIERFNGWIHAGLEVDPDQGRPLAGLRPLVEGPFMAIQFLPMARKSLGGVLTDRFCRVRLQNGEVTRNLFAAGEVAGMAGGHINGASALEGTMLGPSLYSGRVAGRAVRDLLSR